MYGTVSMFHSAVENSENDHDIIGFFLLDTYENKEVYGLAANGDKVMLSELLASNENSYNFQVSETPRNAIRFPVLLFTDETSGNLSNSYRSFDSIVVGPAFRTIRGTKDLTTICLMETTSKFFCCF